MVNARANVHHTSASRGHTNNVIIIIITIIIFHFFD
jgi:hypothetical protein